MNPVLRQRSACILLVAYLLSGILLEITHRDGVVPAWTLAFATHDCGAREIHQPLDDTHRCAVCQLQTLRVPVLDFHHLSINVLLVRIGTVPAFEEHLRAADILYSGKRGPPSV